MSNEKSAYYEFLEHVSQSTIDNPPSGKDKNEEKDDGELFEGERLFEMDLTLTLKPIDGKAVKIPLTTGKIRGLLVENVMKYALSDRRTLTIIRAVLDNPSERESVQLSINEKKSIK